jgi:tripartite-type tricarboxylate transporter receptor subunit TctC
MLRSGAKMTGVSYRSGGESNTAVLGQTVDATFENIAILRTLITEGRLRALAVQHAARTPLLPDLPTMAEVGLADCEANTFYGLAAPAGTPASIVAKLNAAINEAMATPEMQRTITSLGSESKPNTPAEFAAFIAAQHKKWLDVGNAAGVKVN